MGFTFNMAGNKSGVYTVEEFQLDERVIFPPERQVFIVFRSLNGQQ
jgi:hypothetical protein